MIGSRPLSALFLGAVDSEVKVELGGREDLEAILRRWVDGGRRAWPDLALSDEVFLPWLARRQHLGAGLQSLRAPDLFLVCACLQGDPDAVQVLLGVYLTPLRPLLLRRLHNPDLVEDLTQSLATKLLVASADRSPKLASYGGRGPLKGWLRAVAINQALRATENSLRNPIAGDEESLLAAASVEHDPELRELKSSSRDALVEAFRTAMSKLPARDKNLLRQHYVDGVPVEKLARLHRVHRVTLSRWLAKARDGVLEHTRLRLRNRFGLGATECDSLIRLARSRLEMTFEMLA